MGLLIKLILSCLLLYTVQSQYSPDFSADFFMTSSRISGFLTGKIYYSEKYQGIRYDYNGSNYYEIYKYDTNNQNDLFVYKACTGKCDIIPQDPNVKQPIFNFRTGDSCATTASTTAKYGSCHLCTPVAGTVTSYCLKDLTTRVPIRVTLKDGTILDLNNHLPGGLSGQANTYTPLSTWGCVLNCGAVADIVLVVDESGSISGNYIPGKRDDGEWSILRKFMIQFVNGFEIAPDKVNMGLVFFSTGSRISLPIISDQSAFRNAIDGLTRQQQGSTWLGTGVINSATLLRDRSGARAARASVPKITVLFTDGYENAPRPFSFNGKSWQNTPPNNLEWLTYHNSPTTGSPVFLVTMGIGTDSEIDTNYLKNIATKRQNGSAMFFRASGFSTLINDELIRELTRTVCTASNATNPCPSCNGLCTCGACGCPSTCDDSNPCTLDYCNSTKNFKGGCLYEPKKCDDKNACTADTCDPSVADGCVFTPISCDDKNACTIDSCNSTVGCVRKALDCDDKNACTIDSCNPATGCVNTPRNCSDGIACTIDNCDPAIGCTYKTKDRNYCFNASDPCKIQDCSPTNGSCYVVDNLCLTDNPCVTPTGVPGVFNPIDCRKGNFCISADCDRNSTNQFNGCTNKTVNCNDSNACTTDSCNPATGCVNTPINCNDSNVCTVDTCDIVLGCQNKNISCDDFNNCTIDTCDPLRGCVNTPIVCNDNNACTTDSCDAVTGCVFTYIDVNITCNDGNVCTTDTCDPVKGCLNIQVNCTVKYNSSGNPDDPCTTYSQCDHVQGCQDYTKCNNTIQKEPDCIINVCDNSESNCQEKKNEVDACTAVIITAGAVLGAAAIAGIVIAGVALLGGAAAASYYAYNNSFKGEFDNKNPLYEQQTKVGTSAIYTGN